MVITSHFAPELERLCDRVGILVGGHLIALGTVAELCRVVADRTVVDLRVAGLRPATVPALRAAPGVVQVSSTLHDAGAGTARLRVHLADDQPLGTLHDVLGARGTVVRWVGMAQAGLEDAFLAYTGDTGETSELGNPGEGDEVSDTGDVGDAGGRDSGDADVEVERP